MRINAGSVQSLRLSEHTAVTPVLPAWYRLHRVTSDLGACLLQPWCACFKCRVTRRGSGDWGKAHIWGIRQENGPSPREWEGMQKIPSKIWQKLCECVMTELFLSNSEYNDWHGLVLFSLMESNLSYSSRCNRQTRNPNPQIYCTWNLKLQGAW